MRRKGLSFPASLTAALLMVLSGCQDAVEREAFATRLAEQSEDLAAIRKELAEAEAELGRVTVWREELAGIEKLKVEWERGMENRDIVESELAELRGELAVTEREFEVVLTSQRVKVRKEWVGRTIDLSATKGEGYERVQIFAVLPTGIKILLSTGTETVPLADLPEEIRDLFLMSESEAAEYLEGLENTAKARAEGYRRWKQEQTKKPEEVAQEVARKRHAEVQARVDAIEREILARIAEVNALKSTASAWELKSAQSIGTKKRSRAIRYALAYREKAQEIADGNLRAREVIAVLREELLDLEKRLSLPAGSGSGR